MTLDDYDPTDWLRFPYLVADCMQALPDDERERILDIVRREPFTFTVSPLPGGWVEVRVGRDHHLVGALRLAALARDAQPGDLN